MDTSVYKHTSGTDYKALHRGCNLHDKDQCYL